MSIGLMRMTRSGGCGATGSSSSGGAVGAVEHQVLTIRLPKIAVPTRTSVAPSWIATSKSWLMPIDSSRKRARRCHPPPAGRAARAAARKYGRACSGSSNHGGSSISPFSRAARQSRAARAMPATSVFGGAELGRLAGEVDLDIAGRAPRPASAAAASTRPHQVDRVDRMDGRKGGRRLLRLVRLEVADQVPPDL